MKKTLESLRKKLKITQISAGEKAKIPSGSISDYEKGRTLPSFDYLLWLSKEAGVSIEYILNGEEPKTTILNDEEKTLIDAYKKAPDNYKKSVIKLLEIENG